ncbi:ABC transporter permease [Dickeya fangzhongdai]|uniref:ABC transporter permease n=1 Tax=Dickeya fangzhongdai TaxID=1778540 RepID=UPI002B2E4B2D|nr:ABC transporter permease [Dickeya fangzhongdai]
MLSLARSILIHEWRRFLPAVLAVAFSGLLVVVQLGLLLGMFGAVSVYIDRSSADLWVGFPDTQSIDLPRPISEKVENTLLMNPEITAVERLSWTLGDWRRPAGGRISAVIIGINLQPNAMTFASLLTPEKKQLLQVPGNLLVDISDLDKLGVKVGDYTELNGKRVRVAGTVSGMRSMGGVNIITSLYTARTLDPALLKNNLDYFLVKIRNPADAERVRDQLQPTGENRRFQVWTAQEFSDQSVGYWIFESGSGSGFLFSSTLGFVVGIVITSQTLMAAIVAALREYATLRAMGVPTRALRKVVLEQSFWIGVAGLLLTTLITLALSAGAQALYVSFTLPWPALIFLYGLVMTITLLSGLMALRALNRAEPFTLLR